MSRQNQAAYERGFITKIEIKDKQTGRVISTQEVVTYKGLLNLAHDDGLKRVITRLHQVPSADNQMTAIVSAEVETKKGVFTAIGDANPENVNPRVRRAIIRMAETRAKARALRDAVNIGVVALEELGQEELSEEAPAPAAKQQEQKVAQLQDEGERVFVAMTDNQRRYIFRLLASQGYEGDGATGYLRELLQVNNLGAVSKSQASAVIQQLVEEIGDQKTLVANAEYRG